jgi:Restriction alleviation protein Lar
VNTLLPCPFCGGEAFAGHVVTNEDIVGADLDVRPKVVYFVTCVQCTMARTPSCEFESIAEQTWNRRTPLPPELHAQKRERRRLARKILCQTLRRDVPLPMDGLAPLDRVAALAWELADAFLKSEVNKDDPKADASASHRPPP